MDQKSNQAVETPAPAADPTPETNVSQDPTAAAEQGTGAVAESTPTESSPTAAATSPAEPAQATEPAEPTQTAEPDEPAEPAQPVEPAPAGPSPIADRADDEITMEDVLAASDEQLARKPVHRGMITQGEVIMLAQDGIVVDVGAKIEGLLPYNQIFEHDSNQEEAAQYLKPGDPVLVYVVRSDVPNNTIILSKRRADAERAWNLLQEVFEKEKPVEVEIIEKVRGGLVASLGVRAFLPASQVDIRRVNELDPYVGQRMKVKIIELNRRRNRVIISRRAILETEIAEQKSETLKHLEPGYRTEGEVVEITDFGVFVNLGGIDGLVHRSELTHGRFNHPRDVVKVGDKVKVEILDMDLERERINLSMKTLLPNPWQDVLANYVIGQRVAGKVTNLTPFGAFVEIEPGLEGLIHVSEMSWTKRVRHPKEIVTEGDEVETMILKIDTQQQRISLGLRQTQPDPWSSLPDRYPPGTEITGPITGITEFGVFMEIEEGIEGLVHISELAHEHIEDINEHFKRGDEVTAVILNIDPVEQRASLSRKRLLPFTAGAGGYDEMGTGGPAARGPSANRQGGRRGGRRSKGIDYDYSYAASEAGGGKATTKLGDVYADLFAQFGLSEAKEEPKADKAESKAEAKTEAKAEPAAAPAPKPAAPKAAASEEAPVDAENAIDAAEAAALLTAAFRDGKRPAKAEANGDAPAPAPEAAQDAAQDADHDAAHEAAANEAAAEDAAEAAAQADDEADRNA